MNKLKKIIIIALLILLTVGPIQYLVLADSRADLTITTDVLEMYPGNNFTVSITFTSKSEDISIVEASIEYDADIIEYQFGGNAIGLSAGTGGIADNIPAGTKTITYEIRFKALKAGEARIELYETQLIGQNSGSVIGEPVGDIMVKVSKPNTEPGGDIEEPKETPPSTEQPRDIWLESTLDGDLIYISSDLSDVTLPLGFVVENMTYQDEEIQVARDGDKDLTLFYIRKRGFTSFYIYDEHGLIYPYAELNVKANYIILDTQERLSNSMETDLLLGDKIVKAWVSDIYGEDFYIVYAMNPRGSKGFYLYDSIEGSLQRLITEYDNTIKIDEEN
ncbi:MAG: hypothetical protein GX783_07340 [Clostridiales bacterium]|nr:hypothetical protein [Clostridiales bacterium]